MQRWICSTAQFFPVPVKSTWAREHSPCMFQMSGGIYTAPLRRCCPMVSKLRAGPLSTTLVFKMSTLKLLMSLRMLSSTES